MKSSTFSLSLDRVIAAVIVNKILMLGWACGKIKENFTIESNWDFWKVQNNFV
jgi:hypothetical protein